MARRIWPPVSLYAAAVLVYGLDRLTKSLAEGHLRGGPPIDIIPGAVRLRYTTNAGGAFGLGGGQPWVFFGATLAVSLVIVAASPRVRSRATGVGLGMILGGALGNVTDRIIRGPGVSGRVIDFIDFRVWPVFNVADSAIVIGAILVALSGARRRT